ncbi:hypothetical protein UlMin_035676 [Ulmus minor]
MEDYDRSKSYGGGVMPMDNYYGQPSRAPSGLEIRSYSASYAQTQMGNTNNREMKIKKGKGTFGSSSSKSWNFGDPEFQRKRRVATYKMYSVEGKVKGSFRKSFRWLKDKYTQVLYGWW